MAATFKYGLTSGSLTTLASAAEPNGVKGISVSRSNNFTDYIDVNGARLRRFTGVEKQDIDVSFNLKSMANYLIIKRMCNVPQKYWIEIADTTNTWFEGFAFLTMGNGDIKASNDPFVITFSVKIIEA